VAPYSQKNLDALNASEAAALYGPESLSDEQILSTLLSEESPAPSEILAEHSLQRLITMGPFELLALSLTRQDVARLLVLHEIQRRSTREVRSRITSPRLAAAYLLPKAAALPVERFGIVCLDAQGCVTADLVLSQGTAMGTLVSPREFYREALRYGAISALAWHNHPSGNPEPSREDRVLTDRLRRAGDELGVSLADHLILGADQWFSFRADERWDSTSSNAVFEDSPERAQQ